MILINFRDGQGLGNQLWLLFTAIYLTDKLKRVLKIRNIQKFKGKALIDKNFLKDIKIFNSKDINLDWTVIEAFPYVELSSKEKIYFQENNDFIEIVKLFSHVEISGNFQSINLLPEPKKALKYFHNFTYDDLFYSQKGICIINIRGGDYLGIKKSPCVEIEYFLNAMNYVKNLVKDVKFFIVTDDYDYAGIILPNVKIIKGNLEDDFKNLYLAKYLILSNSSFAFFPTFISPNLRFAIAPYRWAASNKKVKNKAWFSPHNYSKKFIFMGNNGEIFPNLNYFEVAINTNKKIIPSSSKFIYSYKYKKVNEKKERITKNSLKIKLKRIITLFLWRIKRFNLEIKNSIKINFDIKKFF